MNFIIFSFLISIALGDIVFSFVLARHGARAPKRVFPFNSANWEQEELSQITPYGLDQMYKIGETLRDLYKDKLIDESFTYGQLEILSSDMTRTLVSAYALGLGLYPPFTGPLYKNDFALPFGIQPLPIRSELKGHEEILHAYKSSTCPRIGVLKKEMVKSSWYKTYEDEHLELFHEIGKKLGIEIKDIDTAKSIRGSILCDIANEKGFPKQLSREEYDQLTQVHNWHELNVPFSSEEVLQLTCNGLFRRLNGQFEKAFTKGELKLAVYVAHDHTLIAILKCLGHPITEIPFFASYLRMELHHDRSLKFFFNEKPILENFTHLDELYGQMQKYTVENFDQACLNNIIS